MSTIKTIVYIGTSLDNFIARENGEIDWLMDYSSPEVFQSYEELMKRVDAILMGRNTFEKVVSFPSWPYTCKVYVVSKTMKEIPASLRDKAELLQTNPKDILAYLSDKGLTAVYVDGGKLIQSFLKEDLVDELIQSRVPVLIGKGIPLYSDLDFDLKFTHLKTESFTNGLVMSFYERRGHKPG